MDLHLIAPHEARVVVRDLPGWSQSASALFDRVSGQISREQLLQIAEGDAFGAHLHFPILVRIRLSGRVPPQLAFDPGEALRLNRWRSDPDTDHLVRAWCCTLMVIAPGSGADDLADVAAQLVDSCLVLGGDLPELAERLLAWRAVSEEPEDAQRYGQDHGCADPVALLALLLLRAATEPSDARLAGLAQIVADAFAAPQELHLPWSDDLPWLMRSVSAPLWQQLIDAVLAALRPLQPDVDRLVTALSQPHPGQ